MEGGIEHVRSQFHQFSNAGDKSSVPVQ